jgi:hypothetical protein
MDNVSRKMETLEKDSKGNAGGQKHCNRNEKCL